MQVGAARIVVLGTGGTIAGRAASAQENLAYRAAELGVGDLLHGVAAPAGMQVLSEQVAQLDSKDMQFSVWCDLATRCDHWLAQPDVAGVVVTHGTDTMEETAFFLHSVLDTRKPVVLTGAMRPASSAEADGPRNLADALTVAASGQGHGVCVVFAGEVHGAPAVRKVHSYRLDAFSSGDAGPIARVGEDGLHMLREWPHARPLRASAALAAGWPRVEIVMSHAGATGAVVDALVNDGVAGIVVAATGNGTVHHALEEALLRAQQRGVAVRRSSRCAFGQVPPLPGDRLPAAEGLTPVQARIALMLELMQAGGEGEA